MATLKFKAWKQNKQKTNVLWNPSQITPPRKMWGEIDDTAPPSPVKEEDFVTLREDLLAVVSLHPEARFKSQHKDDPDWTQQEKRQMAQKALEENPGQFLARYGSLLQPSHLEYFRRNYKGSDSNYEVQFRLQELGQDACQFIRQKRVRNRRYQALKNMIENQDEYFGEEAMKARNPMLYEELIGRHLTETEKAVQDKINRSNCALSTIILDHMDLNAERERKKNQERQELIEEFDEEDESDESVEKEKEEEEDRDFQPSANEDEKQLLKDEFVRAMHQNFLDGKDVGFDYAKVDGNRDLDDLEMIERDEEERYFDED